MILRFLERDNLLKSLIFCHARVICIGHRMLNILERTNNDMSLMTIPLTSTQTNVKFAVRDKIPDECPNNIIIIFDVTT